jgi:hypothetical protein
MMLSEYGDACFTGVDEWGRIVVNDMLEDGEVIMCFFNYLSPVISISCFNHQSPPIVLL